MRKYRLFAKDKTKKVKDEMVAQASIIGELHETITKLLPQIRYWLRTGFVASGKIISAKKDFTDTTFVVAAVEQVAALFGKVPRSYACDRGGHSEKNIERLRELGVRDVGLAPEARHRGRSRGRSGTSPS